MNETFWYTEPYYNGKIKFKLKKEFIASLAGGERSALATFLWDDGLAIEPGEEAKYAKYAERLLKKERETGEWTKWRAAEDAKDQRRKMRQETAAVTQPDLDDGIGEPWYHS